MRRQIWSYSLGNIGTNSLAQAFSTYVLFFYVDHLGANVGLITLALSIQSVWHAVLNPAIGYWSDRTRSRYGRRLPYIALATLPLSAVFVLLWHPLVPRTDLFWYFLVIVAAYDALYLIAVINWTSLFPEIFRTLEERTQAESWRQWVGIIALMAGVAAPPLLYSHWGWTAMALALAIPSALGYLAVVWGSLPWPARPIPPKPPYRTALRRVLGQPGFLPYLLANFLVQFTLVLIPAGLPFYAKYVLHVTHLELSAMLAASFLTAMALIPAWSRAILRWGSHRTFQAALLLLALAVLPFFLVTHFVGGLITTVGLGVGLAGFLMLIDVIMSELIDDDARRHGARQEGVFYGINGFVLRLGPSLQALAFFVVLHQTGYHPSASGVEPRAVRDGFRLLLAGIPFVSLIGAWWAFRFCRVPESPRRALEPSSPAS